jgi:hypothetical protein
LNAARGHGIAAAHSIAHECERQRGINLCHFIIIVVILPVLPICMTKAQNFWLVAADVFMPKPLVDVFFHLTTTEVWANGPLLFVNRMLLIYELVATRCN